MTSEENCAAVCVVWFELDLLTFGSSRLRRMGTPAPDGLILEPSNL